jgi:UDP-N-acetylglucosamine 1-carboxyvinyltransferase
MNILSIIGGERLQGVVDVAGSKNSALSLLSAVVLVKGKTVLTNVPDISDTRIKAQLLAHFGAAIEWSGSTLSIDCTNLLLGEVDEVAVRSIRTSFFLMGPLLARLGYVNIPAPGGCKIGARPVDLHLKGLAAMGAEINFEGGIYTASCQELRGAEVYLDVASPGATQHLMTTAALAKGWTTIDNAAMEPEVTALADFLKKMGARVEGAGTSTITIQGVQELQPCEFRVPSDRMQAGTYLLAGAITGGDVTARGILPDNQLPVVKKLREAGAVVTEGNDWVRVQAQNRLNAIRVKTMPYPGFPTDMQQPMTALLTLATGTSTVEETVYEARIGHIQELNRMGADIQLQGKTTILNGVDRLRGAAVEATDLRAGAALILAALAAEGETTIRNVHFIDRGYERIEKTIQSLGGRIERVTMREYATS